MVSSGSRKVLARIGVGGDGGKWLIPRLGETAFQHCFHSPRLSGPSQTGEQKSWLNQLLAQVPLSQLGVDQVLHRKVKSLLSVEEFMGNNVGTVHLVVKNTVLPLISCVSSDKIFKQFDHL